MVHRQMKEEDEQLQRDNIPGRTDRLPQGALGAKQEHDRQPIGMDTVNILGMKKAVYGYMRPVR